MLTWKKRELLWRLMLAKAAPLIQVQLSCGFFDPTFITDMKACTYKCPFLLDWTTGLDYWTDL